MSMQLIKQVKTITDLNQIPECLKAFQDSIIGDYANRNQY